MVRDGDAKLILDLLTVLSAPPSAIPNPPDAPLPHAVAAVELMDFDVFEPGISGALYVNLPTS